MPSSKFVRVLRVAADNVTWQPVQAPSHNGRIEVSVEPGTVAWAYRTTDTDPNTEASMMEGQKRIFEWWQNGRSPRDGEVFIWVRLATGAGTVVVEGTR